MDDYMKKYIENMLKSEESNLKYLTGHGRKEEAEESKKRIISYKEQLGIK